jgi:hypothetical protein
METPIKRKDNHMKEPNPHSDVTEKSRKGSFAAYLINSGYKPLVFIGKSMEYFGLRTIIAFIVGVMVTYAYSQIDKAPYHDVLFNKHPTQKSSEMMEISGFVKDWNGNPLSNATAYIVPSSNQVPIIDGKAKYTVPKGYYKVLVSTHQSSKYAMFDVWENKPDTYSFDLQMPPGVGSLHGKVVDRHGTPKQGKFVCIFGGSVTSRVCKQTDSKGEYLFDDIPEFSVGAGQIVVTECSSQISQTITNIAPHKINEIPDIQIIEGKDPIVFGTLRDRNNRPVSNIWVSIDRKYGTYTSYDGRFTISVPTGGQHRIEVWVGNRSSPYYAVSLNINHNPFKFDIKLN